jgi:hypothetical protein
MYVNIRNCSITLNLTERNLQGTEPNTEKQPCSIDGVVDGSCRMTQVGEIVSKIMLRGQFFSFVFYWITWVFIAFWLVGVFIAACQVRLFGIACPTKAYIDFV